MRFVTGIKPTGTMHLGNYLSVIKPIFDIAQDKDNSIYCFIADGHALTTQPKSKKLSGDIEELCKSLFSLEIHKFNNLKIYRQSQIPEIFEMFWFLSCFTSKGLLNRNHSYMVEKEKNIEQGKDEDKGINVGLFNYPVLMAADILSTRAEKVLIGKDQKQHIDITRDITERVNSFYKGEVFTKPEGVYAGIDNVIGTDGRKMSKSYNNVIPLFSSDKSLRKKVFSIPTNSKNVGELKYKEESSVCTLIEQMGSKEQIQNMNEMLVKGNSWGDLKELCYSVVSGTLKKQRENYRELDENPQSLEIMNDYLEKEEREVRKEVSTYLKVIKYQCGFVKEQNRDLF